MSRSIVFAIAVLLSAFCLVLTFVAAPRYDGIFVIIMGLSSLSLACLVYLRSQGGGISLLIPLVLILYAVADTGLRIFTETRVLGLFGVG